MSASRSVWPVVLALSNLYALSKASARTSSALIRAFLANLYEVNNTQLQRERLELPFHHLVDCGKIGASWRTYGRVEVLRSVINRRLENLSVLSSETCNMCHEGFT